MDTTTWRQITVFVPVSKYSCVSVENRLSLKKSSSMWICEHQIAYVRGKPYCMYPVCVLVVYLYLGEKHLWFYERPLVNVNSCVSHWKWFAVTFWKGYIEPKGEKKRKLHWYLLSHLADYNSVCSWRSSTSDLDECVVPWGSAMHPVHVWFGSWNTQSLFTV